MFKIKIRLLFLFIKLYEIVMEFNSRHSKVNKLNNAAMFPQKIFVPLKCLLHHPRNLTIKTFAYRCISRHQCVYILKRVNHVRSGLFWFGNILFVFFCFGGSCLKSECIQWFSTGPWTTRHTFWSKSHIFTKCKHFW